MFRQKSASAHQFAMVPRADIPRSRFKMEKTLKTTFNASDLVPIFCEEVLPGDTFNVRLTTFCRLATPLFPIMDNLRLDTIFFFVPNRLVWDNFVKMMGEQDNPGDTISYSVPQMVSPVAGYVPTTLHDYFGLPTVGQVGGAATVTHSALPLRGYNKIYNQWFRDENLINSVYETRGDGPDVYSNYAMLRRGKRHDYFTSCLPWTLKGGVQVTIPLGSQAPVVTLGTEYNTNGWSNMKWKTTTNTSLGALNALTMDSGNNTKNGSATGLAAGGSFLVPSNLFADLSTATAATINQLRQSFQIQKLLERDARGGTRYTEILSAHFGVRSPDARLQRTEYLGGGRTPININPIAQTSATGVTGGTTPVGTLAAMGTSVGNHGFSQSFVEHGHVIGLACVTADLTYQQGLRRFWSRLTRYDFYWPAFAMLGEQGVLNKEIYCDGSAADAQVFGYQERWGEYRYNPSQITGLFRSTSATTIDPWHLAQRFTVLPTLNSVFITENVPLSRILAVGAGAAGQQILFDGFYDITAARPLPMYSVPGLVDHF